MFGGGSLKSQAVLIGSMIAAIILMIASTLLFLRVYSYTSSYTVEQYGVDVYDILRSRQVWTARDLAEEIMRSSDAVYVKVVIHIRDLLTGDIIGVDEYEVSVIGVDRSTINVRKYTYSYATRDAYLYMYLLEVGYR